MTAEEIAEIRRATPVLVACAKTDVSRQIRGSLLELGFSKISAVFSHLPALAHIKTQSCAILFFDSRDTDMTVGDFIAQAQEAKPQCCLIAVADEFQMDDIFGLLSAGARSFLLYPFTLLALEESIDYSHKMEGLAGDKLTQKDRCAILVTAMLNNFNMLCRVLAASRNAPDSFALLQETRERRRAFEQSAAMAKAAASESVEYQQLIIDSCLADAATKLSHLGKLRQTLKKEREKRAPVDSTQSSSG